MAKGSYAASKKGVFLNKRRLLLYKYIRESKCRSLEEIIEFAKNSEFKMHDYDVAYHLCILKLADYICEQDSYGQKIYKKTWFSSKNL